MYDLAKENRDAFVSNKMYNIYTHHHVLVSLSFNFPLSDEGYQIIMSSQTACVGLTTIRLFTSVLLNIS